MRLTLFVRFIYFVVKFSGNVNYDKKQKTKIFMLKKMNFSDSIAAMVSFPQLHLCSKHRDC